MKIGFSFGRCVRSIVENEVDINDVLCVIARTHMETEAHVEYVISQYLRTHYLRGMDPDRCIEVGLELFRSGRVIEPRANGIRAMQVPSEYVWMDLFPTVPTANEATKNAWQSYRMLLGLIEQVPEEQGAVEAVGNVRRVNEADKEAIAKIDPAILQALIV